MSFDEEHRDVHGECAAEIHRLTARVAELEKQHLNIQSARALEFAERDRLRDELEWARSCLTAINQDYATLQAMRLCAQRGLRPKTTRLGEETPSAHCEWCANGNEAVNGVHRIDRGLQYLVCTAPREPR